MILKLESNQTVTKAVDGREFDNRHFNIAVLILNW